jgi:hypothetical protein
MTNPDDVRRRKEAEEALQFMVEQSLQITPREAEADKLLAPVRARRMRNHYLEEARELLEHRRGK